MSYLSVTYTADMVTKLTDLAVRNLKAGGSTQRDVFDGSTPAFGVRVTPQGTKSFFVFYRVDGKLRRYTLGRWPTLTTGAARSRAREALLIAAGGKDPQRVKGTERRHGKPAFADFVEEFVTSYAKPRNRTWQETHRILKREFVEHWGNRAIHKITRSDVLGVLDTVVARGSPSQANAALAAIRRLFKWAVERDQIDVSPCSGLSAPSPLVSRDRVLMHEEIKCILSAATQMGYPYGELVWLLLLTAQRRSEVAEMHWRELDLNKGSWEIPARRTKNGKAHILPLSQSALQILAGLPRLHQDFVFPARGKDNAVSGFGKWKATLDALSGVTSWRLHDLRRTAASGMARLKTPPHVIERVLNHSSGILGGVAGVYNRHAYYDEMQEALEQWALSLANITSGNIE